MPVDPNNGGAFGFAVSNLGWGTFQLDWVDDNANSLRITTEPVVRNQQEISMIPRFG